MNLFPLNTQMMVKEKVMSCLISLLEAHSLSYSYNYIEVCMEVEQSQVSKEKGEAVLIKIKEVEVCSEEKVEVDLETSLEWESPMFRSMGLIKRLRLDLSMLLEWNLQNKKYRSL